MQLFFSLEHLEAIVGLLIGLISIMLKLGRPKEREWDGEMASQWRSQNTHNYQLNLPLYMGAIRGVPK